MSITGITPTQGPSKGGTVITIFGENLGIGNRKISSVNFTFTSTYEKIYCQKPQVQPEVAFGVVVR